MDVKVTLSFEENIAAKAKEFAAEQGMSLSRLIEFMFEKMTANPTHYKSLEDIPIADFVNMVAEERPTYIVRKQKKMKEEYYKSRK
ncbi:MAG: DUF6364 family protein [Bacteroidota bacterium]